MTEHTAGSWRAYEWPDVGGGYWAVNADTDYKLIAKVYDLADARLIAAAPELLAAAYTARDAARLQYLVATGLADTLENEYRELLQRYSLEELDGLSAVSALCDYADEDRDAAIAKARGQAVTQ